MQKILIPLSLIILLYGCSSGSYSLLINKSHKSALAQKQKKELASAEAFYLSRSNPAISRLIDSVVTIITQEEGCDTLYIVEKCNPPLYEYIAYIWGRTSMYLVRDGYPSAKAYVDTTLDKRFKSLIEEWNQEMISRYSNSKPFAYFHPWTETVVATRIIISKEGPKVSSVVFRRIDFDSTAEPSFLD